MFWWEFDGEMHQTSMRARLGLGKITVAIAVKLEWPSLLPLELLLQIANPAHLLSFSLLANFLLYPGKLSNSHTSWQLP